MKEEYEFWRELCVYMNISYQRKCISVSEIYDGVLLT